MPDHAFACAKEHSRTTVYAPEVRPGFVAWVTAFWYPNGDLGVSFNEAVRQPDPDYTPPRLEMGQAVGAPVSYGSVECGDKMVCSYRVYLRSSDGGKSFYETGRCPLSQGAFCNVALSDGSIAGYNVPRINREGTGWCDYIRVSRSADGGSTWTEEDRLLTGQAPYLWRARRLKDGTVLLLTSLYGTPWGEGRERATRNTMLPGETALSRIQTCFLASGDGLHFTGPHYVLPGIGAHEYDVAECPDGRLLFIAGDVQATPVGRQFVTRDGERYYNGALLPIGFGAPSEADGPQSGFVPESLTMDPKGLLIGSRRNKPYSVSPDYGENWYPVDSLPNSLYQPFLTQAPDGRILNFGHRGGDSALGQEDMIIGVDDFTVESDLPPAPALTLARRMTPGRDGYENAFSARLTLGGRPAAGERITFRAQPVWNEDGTVCAIPQREAQYQVDAVTGADGVANASFPDFDSIADIHYYYNIDAVYQSPRAALPPCQSPTMCVSAMTPKRNCPYPYDAYFAEGTLYLSPDFLARFPDAIQALSPYLGQTLPVAVRLPLPLEEALIQAHAAKRTPEGVAFFRSIHASAPLADVRPMPGGDDYI